MLQQTKNIFQHARNALTFSVIIFILAMIGFIVVGQVYSDIQSRQLLEAIAPSVRTLCFAVITTSATIIPLLMTMISLARKTDDEFDETFYIRLRIITFLGTLAIISATLLLLVISIPVTESDNLSNWYGAIYGAVVMGASAIASMLVSIVVTLYETMGGLLQYLTPKLSSS